MSGLHLTMHVVRDVVMRRQAPDAVWAMAVAQAILQGVLACQYNAYRRQSKASGDSRWLSAFVLFLTIVSLLQTSLELYKSFRVLVQAASWIHDPLRWGEFVVNGILCNAIQGFFIRRCWQATRSRLLLVALSTTLLLVLAANIWLTIEVLSDAAYVSFARAKQNTDSARRYLNTVNVMFGIFMGCSAGLDSAITASLTWFLYHSRTGLEKLDAVVYRILNLTWEVQALPMAFAIIACCLYFTRHFDYVLFFSLMTGKLYLHGLFRTLLVRAQLRRRIIQEEMCMRDLQPWSAADQSTNKTRSRSEHTIQFVDGGDSVLHLPSPRKSIVSLRTARDEYLQAPGPSHTVLDSSGASAV